LNVVFRSVFFVLRVSFLRFAWQATPVIFHKNAREYIQYSLRFLFHLTKNLTTHLSHNLCAVLPLSDNFLIIKRALCPAYCGHSAFSFVEIQSARAFYMSMFKNGIFHNVKFVKNAGEREN